MVNDNDILLMNEASQLAQKGEGHVNPNPLVGALIVKDGKIIAKGYHQIYGDLHAERMAFKDADSRNVDCKGATMYVTLEPCCHYGKQPPCTEAIIEHGIARVVVGLTDPNPLVAGKGIDILRKEGIEVEVIDDVQTIERLKHQNRVFLHYIQTGLPWVTAKWAMTLDGKIATGTGDSKWVTGEKAREYVHLLRRRNVGIICGIGTVLADDPELNVRLTPEQLEKWGIADDNIRQPVRIVADRLARIPLDSKLVKSAKEQRLVVVHSMKANPEKLKNLEEAGVTLWECSSLTEAMARAGKERIDSILLEGGGILNEAMLSESLINEVNAFIAPKIVGGHDALSPVEGTGISIMNDAAKLQNIAVEKYGDDIMVNGIIAGN